MYRCIVVAVIAVVAIVVAAVVVVVAAAAFPVTQLMLHLFPGLMTALIPSTWRGYPRSTRLLPRTWELSQQVQLKSLFDGDSIRPSIS